MSEFKLGDVVVLKSGGPRMTVVDQDEMDQSRFTCVYHNEVTGQMDVCSALEFALQLTPAPSPPEVTESGDKGQRYEVRYQQVGDSLFYSRSLRWASFYEDAANTVKQWSKRPDVAHVWVVDRTQGC